MISNNNDIILLKAEISHKREQWRNIRNTRLNKKNELLSNGYLIKEIRKQKEYRQLKREQNLLSKEIKHLERKLNHKLSGRTGS